MCGIRYAIEPPTQATSCWLAPMAFVVRIGTALTRSPDLDVAANLEQIRTGDPEKIRRALGFLLEMASYAREAQPIIEAPQDHSDLDIALRARDVIVATRP